MGYPASSGCHQLIRLQSGLSVDPNSLQDHRFPLNFRRRMLFLFILLRRGMELASPICRVMVFGLHTYYQGNVCVSKHITAYQHIRAYRGISTHINAYQNISNSIEHYQRIKHVEAYQSVSKHIKTYRSILLASLPSIQFMSQF